MAEKFFWADQIAENIIREKGNKKEYVCASGITPSGTIHIGNFREVITTELVVRALRDKGKKVRFIYSWDDYDRFRKVPKNVNSSYEKYIGMPLTSIPSPHKKSENYAQHFEKEFEVSLEKVGIQPEFIHQTIMNTKCKYHKQIKKSLDERKKIINILDKYRKESLGKDWYPIIIYCEKCKKDFTKILEVKGYNIKYECKCGHENQFDYRKKGIVKLKWRADWPARWVYEDVDFEASGIDHQVKGGSFMTGKEIVKDIFKEEGPIGLMYEWVRLKGGKEFSSSSGNAVSLEYVESFYEPEILRYLFVGTRPKKGFQISFDADIIKEYEEFDDLEHRYFEGLVNPQEKRIYELSQINIPKKKPNKLGFKHLITLVQVGQTKNLNLDSKLRAEKVKNWLKQNAPDEFKFEFQDKILGSFSDKEKEVLIELKEVLATKKHTEDSLFNAFYEICNARNISAKDFFKLCYETIIGKSKGPRLVSLILTIGQDKVVKLLEQI